MWHFNLTQKCVTVHLWLKLGLISLYTPVQMTKPVPLIWGVWVQASLRNVTDSARTGTSWLARVLCTLLLSCLSSHLVAQEARAALASYSVVDEWFARFYHVVSGHRERGWLAGDMELSPRTNPSWMLCDLSKGYEPTTALEVTLFHVCLHPAWGGMKELTMRTCPSSAHLLSLENCFDFVFEIKDLV